MITETELILLSTLNRFQLHDVIKGKSFNQALEFRKEIQIALAAYAKQHKYDRVQEKVLVICQKIEKWIRQAYLYKKLKLDIAKINKNKVLVNQMRPQIRNAKNEFEEIIKKSSY